MELCVATVQKAVTLIQGCASPVEVKTSLVVKTCYQRLHHPAKEKVSSATTTIARNAQEREKAVMHRFAAMG